MSRAVSRWTAIRSPSGSASPHWPPPLTRHAIPFEGPVPDAGNTLRGGGLRWCSHLAYYHLHSSLRAEGRMLTRMSMLLVLSVLSCATGYHAHGLSGGFSETQLDENVFQVSFKGNGYTSRE